MISASVVDAMIRTWKLARIARGGEALAFPSTNILHPTHGTGGWGGEPAQGLLDAERVQSIVEQMGHDIRQAFETYHLGVSRGDYKRDTKDRQRWIALDISKSTYHRRVQRGWVCVQEGLDNMTLSC